MLSHGSARSTPSSMSTVPQRKSACSSWQNPNEKSQEVLELGELVEDDPVKPACSRQRREHIVNKIIPPIIIGLIGYYLYAFCYVVVWRRVERKNRGAAIAILTLSCCLLACVFTYWGAVHIYGPGRINHNYEQVSENDPFVCDSQGYALWCSECKHIKPSRTRHSTHENACVPVMDHFCVWLGAIIGQGNVKFFLLFALAMWMELVLVLVTLFIYQHEQVPHINGNSIALYVITPCWLIFTTLLGYQHFGYLLRCDTTLDSLDLRHGRFPFLNIPYKGTRRIIAPTVEEMLMGPYNMGKWKNIIKVMGPLWMWFLPIRGPISEPRFNEAFIKRLQDRIEREDQAGIDPAIPKPFPEKRSFWKRWLWPCVRS